LRTTAPTTRGAVARALGRAALLAAAIAAGPAAPEAHAQDQSRGYWATDGCYYAPAQGQWTRVECRSYDRAGGIWVAQNRVLEGIEASNDRAVNTILAPPVLRWP
jgi:hypothetical protein